VLRSSVLAALLGIRVAESISASLDLTRDAAIIATKTRETTMGSPRQRLLISLLLAGIMSSAWAADRKPDDNPSAPRPVLTGKERLGRKWTDEQRIDNCKVPIDKRGAKPRPSACPGAPST
jgi:hypothetical protein